MIRDKDNFEAIAKGKWSSAEEDTTWRMMVGPFRVLYDVHDDRSLVVVLKIDRRSDIR